jgi:hypothetical protein
LGFRKGIRWGKRGRFESAGAYLPFPCEFYFNGHNVIKRQLEEKGIAYRMKDNAFTWVEEPEVFQQIAQSLTGRQLKERIAYWLGPFLQIRQRQILYHIQTLTTRLVYGANRGVHQYHFQISVFLYKPV